MDLTSSVLCVIDVYIENQFLYFIKIDIIWLILLVFVFMMDVDISAKRVIVN